MHTCYNWNELFIYVIFKLCCDVWLLWTILELFVGYFLHVCILRKS